MLWNKARRVIQRRSRAYRGLAFYHRQVEPGLRSNDVAGFAKNSVGDTLNRGQLPWGTVLVVQHLVGGFVVGELLRLCIPIQSLAQRL